MKELSAKHAHIKGWGIDADPENDPTYPMKKYTGDNHRRLDYPRPPQQKATVEVLHSNERPNLTSVYGDVLPPSGLSGKLRRYAFKYSEGSFGHWIPLLLADRINMVEGLADDFRNGHIPNIFAERGWKSEWKHNRPAVIKRAMIGIGIAAMATVVISALRSGGSHEEDD